MKFIDIEQHIPQGQGFSSELHCSSLIIYRAGLQVLGVIPHSNLIRPKTAMQRDMWIAHLQGLTFDEPESEYDKAKQTAGRDYFGPRKEIDVEEETRLEYEAMEHDTQRYHPYGEGLCEHVLIHTGNPIDCDKCDPTLPDFYECKHCGRVA